MNFNVALLNDNELGKELAKKGTATDFTIYNIKQGGDTFCFFNPHLYPDKIQSLINVLMLTESTIIVIKQLDKYLGEMVVALDLMGKEKGLIIFDEYVEKDKFVSLVAGNSIEKFVIVNKNPHEVYEKLQKYFTTSKGEGEDFKLNVDAFFDVKSVGTVVLGVVKQGQVNVHDELQLYPTDKKVTVRSLQVHDEDVKTADKGSRVGLAIKGAGVEDLDRGMILAKPGSLQVASEITLGAKFSKYYTEKPEAGKGYLIAIGMQYNQAKLLEIKDDEEGKILKFQLQSPVVFSKGEQVLIVDIGAKTRICGVGAIQ
jgi:selenocysteine-specific translation elongation factor